MLIPFRKIVTATALSLLALALYPGAAGAQYRDEPSRDGGDRDRVEIATFHDALDRYGRWFEHPQYGYVWSPEVDRDWRPYTRGKWQFTEEHGWYWQAEEPWGWAVFHYGRWFLDDDSGWVWVPGTDWAPAWVSWRNNDEAVGWAPLPPEAEWRYGSLHFSPSYYDSPRFASAWIFAPVAVLTGYAVYRYIYPPSRNFAYINQTRFVPNHHQSVNNRIYNAGFDHRRAQQLTGRPITPLRIVSAPSPDRHGWGGGSRGEVHVYRPNVSRAAINTPPPRLSEPPRRDWQHGRPGVQAPPFQRPAGWTQPQPSVQQPQRPTQQPGFAGPGQRPPISAPAPQVQQPTPQPATVPAPRNGQNPLIRPTPPSGGSVQQPTPQPATVPAPRNGQNPLIRPTPPSGGSVPQPPVLRPQQQPAPQQQPQQGGGGGRPQPSAAPQQGAPQRGGQPQQGQGQGGQGQGGQGQGGQGQGQNKGDPRKKQDPNQPQPKQ